MMGKNYLYKTLFVIAFFSFGFFAPRVFGFNDQALATNYTVCDAGNGCDYTSITQANSFVGGSSANTLQIITPYITGNATDFDVSGTPLNVLTNLNCQDSGAVIGFASSTQLNIYAQTAGLSIQNCTFYNIKISASSANANAAVLGNTFQATSSLSYSSGGGVGPIISNNTGLMNISFGSMSTGTITNNIINVALADFGLNGLLLNDSNNIYFGYNDLVIATSTPAIATSNYGSGSQSNITIAYNSFSYSISQLEGFSNNQTVVSLADVINADINHNYFDSTAVTVSPYPKMVVISQSQSLNPTSASVTNNTFVGVAESTFNYFLDIGNQVGVLGADVSVTSNYNLYYNTNPSVDGYGVNVGNFAVGTAVVTLTSNYDGFWNFATDAAYGIKNSSATIVEGGNSKYGVNPYLMLEDGAADNDLYPAPWSNYYDVNGSLDIGANSDVRRSTIYFAESGAIDYSTIDATSTQANAVISSSLRSNDILNFAAGTYWPLNLATTTVATSSITVTGVGDTTIFYATSTTDNAVLLNGFSNSTLESFVAQNASSSVSGYTITNSIYDFGGNTYDDSATAGGGVDNKSVIIGNGACEASFIAVDGTDITAFVGPATSNWNLALVDLGGGGKLTIWALDSAIPDAATLSTACGGALTSDIFINDVFTVSGGVYTYNAATVNAATDPAGGVTLSAGYTNPPSIDLVATNVGGLKLLNAESNTIQNVTSTLNAYGVWFAGTSFGNNISGSVFVDNISSSGNAYDIFSDSDYDNDAVTGNYLSNTSFDTASSSITGTGNVNVNFTARAYVTGGGNPLNGVPVDFVPANNSATTTLYTSAANGSGYTAYTSLTAWEMTSTTPNDPTSGGYNPYNITGQSFAGYGPNTVSQTIDTVNETVNIAMDGAGGEAATRTVCASGCGYTTITAALVDSVVSGDVIQVNSGYLSVGETFPLAFNSAGVTLQCQNGVTIGYSVPPGDHQIQLLNSDIVIQNCSFNNVSIVADGGVASANNLLITNNTFIADTSSFIDLEDINSPTVSLNTGLNGIYIASSTGATISNNTISIYDDLFWYQEGINLSQATSTVINNNTVTSYLTSNDGAYHLLEINNNSSDIIVATNTLSYESEPQSSSYSAVGVIVSSTVNLDFSYNKISVPNSPLCFLNVYYNGGVNVTSTNNTLLMQNSGCESDIIGIGVDDGGLGGSGTTVSVTSTYDLFYSTNDNASAFVFGATSSVNSVISVNHDYDGFSVNNINAYVNYANTFSNGENSVYRNLNPFFQTSSFNLAPFSNFLDVNGDIDIGAATGTRSNTINIDDNGVVDYITVDATSTADIADAIRTGDTINLAIGTYAAIELVNGGYIKSIPDSMKATSSITISGAGAGTIIDDSAFVDGGGTSLLFWGIDNSTIRDLTVQNSTSSLINNSLSLMLFKDATTYYADSDTLFDVPFAASSTIIVSGGVFPYGRDGLDLSDYIGPNDNLNLALFTSNSGAHSTLLASGITQSEIESSLGGVVDYWFDNIITGSGGVYTYNPGVLSGGVSLAEGLTDPPRVDVVGDAGIFLLSSNDNLIENVTSTSNYYDFYFSGTSNNNVVSSSVAQTSELYDLYSDVSSISTNYVKNTSYDYSKVAIDNYGEIDSYSRLRGLITDYSSVPLANVTVEGRDVSNNLISTLESGSDGYTLYSDLFPAYTMSSTTATDLTNGGFNPFTLNALASSTYNASSTVGNLGTSKDLTVTIAMENSLSAPSTPTNILLTPTTSTINISWDAVAGADTYTVDTNAEIEYTTTTESNVTYSDLVPNTPYSFLVKATNAQGDSAWSSVSTTYTDIFNGNLFKNSGFEIWDDGNTVTDFVSENIGGSYIVQGGSENAYSGSDAVYFPGNANGVLIDQTITGLTPGETVTVKAFAKGVLATDTMGVVLTDRNITDSPQSRWDFTLGEWVPWGAPNDETLYLFDLSTAYQEFNTDNYLNAPFVSSTGQISVLFYATSSIAYLDDVTFTVAGVDPDIAFVAADKAALVANDIKGANADLDNIIVALTNPLPSLGANGSTITWVSDTQVVVSNDGQTVNRPTFGSGNATVTITATISKGVQSDTKDFILTVLEEEATVPTSPSNPTVNPSSVSALFGWDDNSINETGFIVDKSTDGVTFTNVVTTEADAVSYNVTGLTPNTQYTFRVAATNTGGTSAYTTSTATYNDAAVPSTPTATANGQTSLNVSWDDSDNAADTIYELYNVTTDAIVTSTITDASFIVTGLTANTSYQFEARAQYKEDNSTWSASSSVSTAVSTAAVASSVTMTLSVGDSTGFTLTGGEAHTATLDSIASGVATVTIASTPFSVSLSAGQSSNNTANGLTVTMNSVGASSAQISITTYTPTVSTPSTGGGGGSAPAAPPAPVTTVSPILSQSFSIVGSTEVMIGNVLHHVQIDSINFDTNEVIFTIESTSITFALKVGEEKLLDTDADSDYDLYVKLNAISKERKIVELTLVTIKDIEFTINKYLSTTGNRNVTLYFNSPMATQMAISNSEDFTNISYEPYQATKKWELTPGDGLKTVYVKLRSIQGGDKILSAKITLVESAVDVPLTPVAPAGFIFTRNLSYGMTHPDVKKLQEILKAQGFFVYPSLTNYFGTVTREAVKKYQQANNISPINGLVGPDTRAALNR